MCTDVQYESAAVRRFVRKFPALIIGEKNITILFLYYNIIIFIIIIIK